MTEGYERDVSLIINDGNLKFDRLRCHKEKHFKPEDLLFASCIQPTSKGNSITCTYQLVVSRVFSSYSCGYEDPEPSISIPITINPSKY
jgi:hypothetical protein